MELQMQGGSLINNSGDRNEYMPRRIRFDQLLDLYWERHASLKPSATSHFWNSMKPLRRLLGHLYWDEIVPSKVRWYRAVRENKEGVKGSTVNREHSILVHIYNCLFEWMREGSLRKVVMPEVPPCFKVKKDNEKKFRRTVALSRKEFDVFMSVAPVNVRKICLYAILTARRRKEIFLLSQENVNRNLGIIQGNQPKTDQPYINKITPTILSILKEATTKQIFKREIKNFRKEFDKARDKAVEMGVPYFQFRDLRRSAAIHAYNICLDRKTVQELLGHTTLQMTDGYINLPSKQMPIVAAALEKEYGEPSHPRQWRVRMQAEGN